MKQLTQQTIEITIAPNGQTRLETKGFEGSQCREASRLLESALGSKASEQLTTEFYRTNTSQHHRTAQGE